MQMSYEMVSDAHMRQLAVDGQFALRRRNLTTEDLLGKRVKCFPSNTTSEDLKNATIFGDFGFVFWDGCFRKVPLSKCFPSTPKRKFVFKLYPPLCRAFS